MQDQRYPLRNVPAGSDGHSAGLPFFLGVPRVGTPPAQIDDARLGLAVLNFVASALGESMTRASARFRNALRRK